MKKQILIFIVIIFAFVLVSADIRLTLNSPQATFINNYNDVVNYYIGVTNKNLFDVDVNIVPSKDLNIAFQEATNFILKSNETKNINYSIIINQTGNYSRYISVTYKGNNETFTLQQILFFIVPLRSGEVIEPTEEIESHLDNEDIIIITDIENNFVTPEPIIYDNKNYSTNEDGLVDITDTISKDSSNNTLRNIFILGLILIIFGIVIFFIIRMKKKEIKQTEEVIIN